MIKEWPISNALILREIGRVRRIAARYSQPWRLCGNEILSADRDWSGAPLIILKAHNLEVLAYIVRMHNVFLATTNVLIDQIKRAEDAKTIQELK